MSLKRGGYLDDNLTAYLGHVTFAKQEQVCHLSVHVPAKYLDKNEPYIIYEFWSTNVSSKLIFTLYVDSLNWSTNKKLELKQVT